MHLNSERLMKEFVEKYLCNHPLKIIDIGSANINGTYRNTFNRFAWTYVGADTSAGNNVDIIIDSSYEWKCIESEYYDVVISGQTLEHVKRPWECVKAMERILTRGGIIMIIVPWTWEVHKYPIDCWRILPDGLESLMCEWCNFIKIDCGISERDTYFIGRKR